MGRNRDDAWNSSSGDPSDSVRRADWDEKDWEAFLLRQDALDAKYQELYETLRDHPQRDEIIAREMGWRLPQGLADGPCDGCEGGCDWPPAGDLTESDGAESSDLFDSPPADDLADIPTYRMAQEYALAVERQLTARLRDGVAADSDAAGAARAAVDVSAQVANGHSLGYERDSLYGNIVCCKRALRSLADCFDSLLALRQRGVVLPHEADELLRRGREVGEGLRERLEDLRRRVWWR